MGIGHVAFSVHTVMASMAGSSETLWGSLTPQGRGAPPFFWRCSVDRDEWKRFNQWLENASHELLRDRHDSLTEMLENRLRDVDVRTDAKKMRRKIERRILDLLDDPKA